MAVQLSRQCSLGEFILEPDRLRLTRNGEPVHLTRKPFQVLLYLIEHRERMVTRKELLEAFWQGHDVYDETLTKCIGAIRKALDDQGAEPRFIITHWAEGYRYIGPFEQATNTEPSIIAIERTSGVRLVVDEIPEADPVAEPGVHIAAAPTRFVLPSRPKSARVWLAGAVCAAIIITTVGLFLYHRHVVADTAAASIRSIAVLPLENLSGDPAQDYFADGMTDALISNLTQIKAFDKVISRQSMMRYKGSRKSLPEIAKELNVDAVIEGTVQRSGGRVRVAARLIPAAADSPRWSRDYERDESDVLKLESDVARAVADEIRIHVTADERARLTAARSVNPQAHEAYLLGRYHLGKVNEKDVKEAIEYFQRAIQLAPDYAAAYAGLSDAWLQQGFTESNLKAIELPALSAALKAIELDEQLAEAHITLANIKLYYLEWTAAEREFKRALELNPGSADAHIYHGLLLSCLGRHNEAIREGQISVQLDPLSSGASLLGRFLIRARRYEEALPYLQRGIELEPDSARAYFRLGDDYVQLGRYDEAMAAYQKAGELVPKSGWFKAEIARVDALTGRQRQAREIISGLKTDPLAVAGVYAALGDKNEAFTILDKAIEEHQFVVDLKEEPAFESLYSDPRWPALLRRMNFPAE